MARLDYSGFLLSSPTSLGMQPYNTPRETLAESGARSAWARLLSDGRPWFALVFLLSALYMARELKRGWVPMDEGMLGLSADYVLRGDLPHRDYLESYTGGLTYLNALAFRILGAKSASLRYALYLFFLAWVPAIYYVASRFVSSPVASALTFLAVAWGPPNYSAAMPSWYNLFFATFGLAALLRYIETQKSAWLVIGGLCGGISFLFKQVGLFFIAAVLLFLLFREQLESTNELGNKRHSRSYRVFLCAAVLIYEVFLLDLVLKKIGIVSLGYFFVPGSLLGAIILWREFTYPDNRSGRLTSLFREVSLFATGVAIPVVIFSVPFIRSGALPDLIRGVFVLPDKQIAHAAMAPTVIKFLCGAAVDATLIVGVFLAPLRFRRFAVGLALFGMACGLFLARTMPTVYKVMWGAIWVLLPTLVIAGLFILVRRSELDEIRNDDLQKLFLVLSVTSLCGMVQFPFTAAIYYCYAAPLVVLAAAAVISFVSYRPRFLLVGAYCFALLYVLVEVTPGFVYAMGQIYEPDMQTVRVKVPRTGGLRTFPARARTYEALNTIIGRHARGDYIFATPDCPEMYFLYGFRNPMRVFFDFFDESAGRTQRILATIHERHINLVVLNEDPLFSDPVPAELRTTLEQEFPNHEQAGYFEVRWKP